jgi:hypothetical protein
VTGTLFVADVGDARYEEIDHLTAGGMNLGWPIYEGPRRTDTVCPDADTSNAVVPIWWYPHEGQGGVVIGAGIYRRPANGVGGFPLEYQGNYFFFDELLGFLRRIVGSWDGWSAAPHVPGQTTVNNWASYLPAVTSGVTGTDGALYYAALATSYVPPPSGQIRRIRYLAPATGVDAAGAGEPVALAAPFPSPAHGAVRFSYHVRDGGPVRLAVFDAAGRLVRRLVDDGSAGAADGVAIWRGEDEHGASVPSGLYFARLEAVDTRVTRQLVWVR